MTNGAARRAAEAGQQGTEPHEDDDHARNFGIGLESSGDATGRRPAS